MNKTKSRFQNTTVWIASLIWGASVCCGSTVHAFANNEEDLFRLGTVHYQRGEWDFAIKRFGELLESTQQDKLKQLSRFYLAESFVAAKRYKEAKPHLLQFIKDNDRHAFRAQAVFRLGEIAFLLDDQELAYESLTRFVKNHAQHPLAEYALPYLGELEIKKGNLQTAAARFQESLKGFPQGKLANESRFGLARVLEKTDSETEAIRFYQYLIERPQSNRVADSLLQLGKIYFRQKNYGQCSAILTRFQREFGDHHLAHPVCYWMGRNFFDQQKFARAELQFQKALRSNPKEKIVPALKFELARCLVEQQRYADAIAHLKEVVQHFSSSEWADDALLLNIQILRNNQQHRLAHRLSDQFRQLFPQSELAHHVMESDAECRFELQEYAAAEMLYRELVAREKDELSEIATSDVENSVNLPTWKYKLAVCLLKQTRDKEAYSTLRSIRLDRCNDETRSAVVLALATIQIERRQFSEAKNNLIEYVDANPGSAAAQKCVVDIALLFAKRGNLQNADEWLNRLESEPFVSTAVQLGDIAFSAKQFAFASQWYAAATGKARNKELKCRALMGSVWSFKEQGNVESTIAAADRLVQSFPEAKQAHEAMYLMAVLCQKSGDHLRALTAFEKLVKLYPESKHVRQSLLSLTGLYRKHKASEMSSLVVPLSQQIALSSADNHLLLYELAWILKDNGETEKAIKCFERLAREYPQSRYAGEATLQLAEAKLQSNDKEAGYAMLTKLSKGKIDPTWGAGLFYQLGKHCFEIRDFETAFEHMNSIALQYPSHSLCHSAKYWAAEARNRAGKLAEAERLFESLTKEPGEDTEFFHKGLLRLAQLRVKLEKWNAAIEVAERLKDNPEFKKAKLEYEADFVMGRAFIGLALFSKSRKAFDQVLQHPQAKGTETAAMAQWLIGETYLHQENIDDAIDAYQKAEILHAYPEWQAAAILQAGKCFELKNDWAKARKNYERVINQYSNFEYANEARERLTEIKRFAQARQLGDKTN